MNYNKYGYIQLIEEKQDISAFNAVMKKHNIKSSHIFMEQTYEKNNSRKEFNRLMQQAEKGDVIIFPSINCIGHDYNEIKTQWNFLTKEKELAIIVVDMPFLDTTKSNSDFGEIPIADLVLQIMTYVMKSERDYFKKRQAAGIAQAKEKGIQFGRREKDVPETYTKLKEDYLAGIISARGASKQLNISHATFLRWIKEK